MYGDRTKIERTNGDPQCCVLIGGKLNLLPAPLIAPLRVYLRRGSGGGGGNYLSLSERSLSGNRDFTHRRRGGFTTALVIERDWSDNLSCPLSSTDG